MPDATVEGRTVFQDYELVFMGRSDSAVANILPAKGETVPVVIWSISERDERNLDVYEGYPHLYTKETVRVELNGTKIEAMAYVMTPGHKYGRPAYHYYQIIAEGYTLFKISYEYLKQAVAKDDAHFGEEQTLSTNACRSYPNSRSLSIRQSVLGAEKK